MTGIVWEEIVPGVARCRVTEWDATVGLVWGSRGALLVDCGASYDDGVALRASAETLSGQPVRWLVLTHPHFDHVLGAGAFRDVSVYAGFADLDADTLVADAEAYGADGTQIATAAAQLPEPIVVGGKHTIDLGDVLVHVISLGRAHSSNDVVVLVPGPPTIVFTGDLVEEPGEPHAGPDADLAWWATTLGRLRRLGGPDARYVPGHGAVVDAAYVRAQAVQMQERADRTADRVDGDAHSDQGCDSAS